MKRRILIIIGSDSDYKQCLLGLQFLQKAVNDGRAEVVAVITASIHRNTLEVLETLRVYENKIDVIIAGAGWANHLTGICDAFLRNEIKNKWIPVIGVGFEDIKNPRNTIAAELSITQVPDTQVIFNDYIGPCGFMQACLFACNGHLPEIKPATTKITKTRSLEEAITFIEKEDKNGTNP